jgi:hypothetical protein
MRVLYFSPRVCWPLISSAHFREFCLALNLALRDLAGVMSPALLMMSDPSITVLLPQWCRWASAVGLD